VLIDVHFVDTLLVVILIVIVVSYTNVDVEFDVVVEFDVDVVFDVVVVFDVDVVFDDDTYWLLEYVLTTVGIDLIE
jgi:hypothetical protein